MELFNFPRFHAQAGNAGKVEDAIHAVLAPTSKEPGCLSIHAFRSTGEERLFYVHGRWQDEAAFERHIRLPHTMHFVETVEKLIDHPLDVTRARQII